jgi:uncharacterized protein
MEAHIETTLPHVPADEARELAAVVERLVAAFQPERIFLFGSRARGDAKPDSDFDLLIVVSTATEPNYRLAQKAYGAAGDYSFSLDLLVMPREEFERRSRALASLPATVLREGRLLYAA